MSDAFDTARPFWHPVPSPIVSNHETHKRQAVVELVFRSFVEEVVQRLDHQNFEHQNHIKRWTPAFASIRIGLILVQIRAEHLKIHSPGKGFKLIAARSNEQAALQRQRNPAASLFIYPITIEGMASQMRTQNHGIFRTLEVTIDNRPGTTTLDGTKISGCSVDVAAGNLNITSTENAASYLITQESAGISFAAPVYGTSGETGFLVNAASGFFLYDTYALTEASTC